MNLSKPEVFACSKPHRLFIVKKKKYISVSLLTDYGVQNRNTKENEDVLSFIEHFVACF